MTLNAVPTTTACTRGSRKHFSLARSARFSTGSDFPLLTFATQTMVLPNAFAGADVEALFPLGFVTHSGAVAAAVSAVDELSAIRIVPARDPTLPSVVVL